MPNSDYIERTSLVIFGTMSNFRTLVVWQRAYAFGLELTRATNRFPSAERFGLTAQLRRGAVSVPSNIAEGARRGGNGEFVYFLGVARRALGEIECQIQFAKDLDHLEQASWVSLDREAQELGRMLSKLMRCLRLKNSTGRRPIHTE